MFRAARQRWATALLALRFPIRGEAIVQYAWARSRGSITTPQSDPARSKWRKWAIMELSLKIGLPMFQPVPQCARPGAERSRRCVIGHGDTWDRDMGQESSCLQSASDEELLAAVGHSGDASAFAELFERFSRRIYHIGLRMARSEDFSRELTQEAMLSVWQKASLFDIDRGSAEAWIFTLTRNRCFDMLRKAKRQPMLIGADDIWPPGEEFEPAELKTDVIAEEHVLLSRVQGMLPQLPAEQQAVIRQVYGMDLTHEEAARRLSIPLGTLKSRLRLGMEKLRHLTGADQ